MPVRIRQLRTAIPWCRGHEQRPLRHAVERLVPELRRQDLLLAVWLLVCLSLTTWVALHLPIGAEN